MSDPRDRVWKDESSLQRLLGMVPGFKGYRELEVRRRADQLLRDHLVGLLDRDRAKLQRFEADLSRAGKLAAVGALDLVLGHLTKARDRLRYADYGYTGFFDTPRLREGDLDRLYAHDLSMRDQLAEVGKQVEAVTASDDATLEAALKTLDASVGDLEGMIDQRGEVIADLASG